MWPFKRKPKPIWKQISREFLRQDRYIDCAGGVVDSFIRYWYLTTYEDILSGKKKLTETWSFDEYE